MIGKLLGCLKSFPFCHSRVSTILGDEFGLLKRLLREVKFGVLRHNLERLFGPLQICADADNKAVICEDPEFALLSLQHNQSDYVNYVKYPLKASCYQRKTHAR